MNAQHLREDLREVGALVGDVVEQAAKLIRNEAELARAEMADKAAQAGRGASLVGAGAILIVPALALLMLAAAAGLEAYGFQPWLSYLIVGAAGFVIAGILMLVGRSSLSADKLTPNVALDQVRHDISAAREMMR